MLCYEDIVKGSGYITAQCCGMGVPGIMLQSLCRGAGAHTGGDRGHAQRHEAALHLPQKVKVFCGFAHFFHHLY